MPEYRYPNSKSYSMLRTGRSTGAAGTLRKGFIFRVLTTNGMNPQIDTSLTKVFQYNPSEIAFSLAAVPLDPAGTEASGGNLDPSRFQIGQASTGISLLFTRDQEVYGAENVQSNDFRVLGVQRDLADIYEILLGPDEALALKGKSARDISGSMFDFAAAGKGIAMSPVGFSFNEYLVVYGWVMSMSWTFPKFNNQLIPTVMRVDMSIDILNISSAQQVLSAVDTADYGGSGYAASQHPVANTASTTSQAGYAASQNPTANRTPRPTVGGRIGGVFVT